MKTKTSPEVIGSRPGVDASAKCRAAKALENIGDYEGAREALFNIWSGIGDRPQVEGLAPEDQAEVLLRVGTLAGWLGSSSQVPSAQEFAKDMISESIRAFEALGNQEKISEAQTDLAICYWREGAMDEGRVWFREALARAREAANRFRILVNSTIVEISTNNLGQAVALLDQAAPLMDSIQDDASLGRYYMQQACVFRTGGGSKNLDRALIEYTAASFHFEKANHRRYFARVENNIGLTFLEVGRYEEALQHLERARRTFVDLGDVGTAAQVNETRARVFLAQEQPVEAEKLAFQAASVLEQGGEQSLLAEALETQGVALARMGRYESALHTLKRAAQTAETAGHTEAAGRTFLTMIEELRSFLAPNEIGDLYQEADRRLGDELSAETVSRLRACARLAVSNAGSLPRKDAMPLGSFAEEVGKRERELIRQALNEAKGSVTRAARLLGLTHQGLCYIINHRHRELLTARVPIRIRRKSVIKKKVSRRRKS